MVAKEPPTSDLAKELARELYEKRIREKRLAEEAETDRIRLTLRQMGDDRPPRPGVGRPLHRRGGK